MAQLGNTISSVRSGQQQTFLSPRNRPHTLAQTLGAGFAGSFAPVQPAVPFATSGSGLHTTPGVANRLGPDKAAARLLHTPPVFQSKKDCFAHSRRRELRANLLPQILRTTAESVEGAAAREASVHKEVEGEFYRVYRDRLDQRAQIEEREDFFLERGNNFLPNPDPQQIVATKCSALRELVAERANRFRRPQEPLVNTESWLPFSHPDQGYDLEELAAILTVDMERREIATGRNHADKRAGALSMQLASRVPFVVRDPSSQLPVSGSGTPRSSVGTKVVRSERLGGHDLYMLRVDLQEGEVRQVAYDFSKADFKESHLASRMSALVDPESGVLAVLVQMFKEKEREARQLLAQLNEVLRDVAEDLPAAEELGEQTGAATAAQRLDAFAAEPRCSLARLLTVTDSLAALIQPLVPSLAHAFDRVALACVREVDRVMARAHQENEFLRKRWAETERSRGELAVLLDRMGQKPTESTAMTLPDEVRALKNELAQQEKLNAQLLEESLKQQAKLEERNLYAAAAIANDGGKALPVHTGVQTERANFFSDQAPPSDEMSCQEYDSLLQMAESLHRRLCSYEWNNKTGTYLLAPKEANSDLEQLEEQEEHLRRVAAPIGAPSTPMVSGRRSAQRRRQAVAASRAKVERAFHRACVSQLEEEVRRLQTCAKERFEQWMARILKELGSARPDAIVRPVEHEALWVAVTELTKTEGMRHRVRTLENDMINLVPLADLVRMDLAGQSGSDKTFWKRVICIAQQESPPRNAVVRIGRPSNLMPEELATTMDRGALLHELASIWASLGHYEDTHSSLRLTKMAVPQVLQGCVKAFYSRKSGRPQHVEAAAIMICRSVVKHLPDDARVAIFALMCGIRPVPDMAGHIPFPEQKVTWNAGWDFNTEVLVDLPIDTARTIAFLVREVTVACRVRRHRCKHTEAIEDAVREEDFALPLDIIVGAGQAVIRGRSHATCLAFWSTLFAFLEAGAPGCEATPRQLSRAPAGADSGLVETTFVSHLLHAYVHEQAASQAGFLVDDSHDREEKVLEELWNQIVEDVCKQTATDPNLGCPADKAGEALRRIALSHVPAALVSTAMTAATTRRIAADQPPGSHDGQHAMALVGKEDFLHLAAAWREPCNTSVKCREGMLLWAALWALAHERSQRTKLVSKLFNLYNEAQDGKLVFSEFKDLMGVIMPHILQRNMEELFLCGAHENTGDISEEVFLKLVSRLELPVSLDHLEHLVSSKREGYISNQWKHALTQSRGT